MREFRRLSSATATLSGIEAIRTIKKHEYETVQPGVAGETGFVADLFPVAA